MDATTKIICPHCQKPFNVEQALAHDIQEKLRGEYNDKFKKLQDQLRESFEKQKREAEEQWRAKVKEDFEVQVKNMTEELEQRKKENRELKSRELDLLKKEQKLQEQQEDMALQMQKKLMEERKQVEDMLRKKMEEEIQLKIKEKDLRLDQLKQQIEEMKKKAEQGSMQMQGEVQELVLEELLKELFPHDRIEEVGKGVKGADIIHTVRTPGGTECGKIIYESKRTKHFSAEWIDKLKTDLRGQKADIALIVTETMPKEMDHFGMRDGVWICTFAEVRGLAAVLRDSLIRVHDIRSAQENKGDKMQLLYDFLTGNEFKQHIEAMVEGFMSMQQALTKERVAMEKLWAEREKQLTKVLLNMSGMYGSIKGIAGTAIAEVKQLDISSLLEGEK